jgi:uncharacterized membrane protein SpoIIM required for sporulation
LNEVAFIESRTPDWQRLSILVEKADVSPKNLTPDELQEIIHLYRNCSSDLALVRTRSNNLQVIGFLNDLVARCYSCLYRPKRTSFFASLVDGVSLAAQTVRKLKFFVLASALTFLLGVGFSFVCCTQSPQLRKSFEPDKKLFDKWKSMKFDPRGVDESTEYAGFYASHNPSVSIMMAAVGAGTFGVGSAFMLWQNGTIMGSLAYEMNTVGGLPFLLGSIMPHGVTELSGMVLAGAAGYQLGWALIVPGRKKRRDALGDAGKDALVVICASIVMMLMAAPVEGFVSFNPRIPMAFKIGFAIFGALAWTIFWIGFGRAPKPEAVAI